MRVPVKGTKRWQFIFDRGRQEGVGQGDGEPGDVLGPGGKAPGAGEAGTEPGEELYEVWLDMDDVEEMLFSELELPRLKPKNESEIEASRDRLRRDRPQGPEARQEGHAAREPAAQREARAHLTGRDREVRPALPDLPRRPQAAQPGGDLPGDGRLGVDGLNRKRMARLFFYWCVQFLRSRYDQTEIVFVSHTTEAREVTEEEFFSRSSPAARRSPPRLR